MDVSIKLEAISLIIIGIIGLFHYEKKSRSIKRYQLFNLCLWLTAATLVSDIISCMMITDAASYSKGLHMIVHSVYFACINSCLSMIAAYVFYLLFEYIPSQKCYRIVKTVVISMWSVLMILIPINLWTGCYFYIANDTYCRGPLNKLGFLVLFIEVGMLCMCYIRNRKVVTPYALQLVRSIPPIVVLFTIAQICFPDTVFTGIIAVCVNMILFACFQSNRIGRDALTEVQNRQRFFEQLNCYKEKGKRAHIILVHLRDFDKVNKCLGMRGGDAFLYNIARYLENLDTEYRVYRYGNTHFTMLGDFKSRKEADALVDQIFNRFEDVWVTGSAEWSQHVQLIHMEVKPGEISENANVEQLTFLLSKQKDMDENTKLFFDEEVKNEYFRKNYVLAEVRKAIENESFELYFQPIYSCKDKKFVSAEVLLRLFTEEGTPISPGEFIPISEEYNLNDEITWLVLRKSMRFLAKYPEIPLETISVNMSVRQMNAEYLNDKVLEAQEKFGELLYKLRIEITENVITQNPDVVANVMRYITEEGAGFYLDDFGVGFSNFSRMLELPFQVIKLDRSMMLRIEKSQKDYNILKSLVGMLHNAGFMVVAEGLETENQVQKATEIGVDRIQGFYYARPMCERDLIEFLEKANKHNSD